MPPNVRLLDLQTLLRRIGRGVICYAHDGTEQQNPVRWDPGNVMHLGHLGDTEGDITKTPNFTVANLTLPEISGDAVYEATYTGENPTIEAPLFVADPDLLALLSPTGSASAGLGRVEDVFEYTVVVFPERLFKRPGQPGYGELSFNGAFRLDDEPLTAAQQTLMAHSVWFWRCYSSKPSRRFLGGHGDAGKNIETVTWTAMMHPGLPDGERLYTSGDPALKDIDIGGGS